MGRPTPTRSARWLPTSWRRTAAGTGKPPKRTSSVSVTFTWRWRTRSRVSRTKLVLESSRSESGGGGEHSIVAAPSRLSTRLFVLSGLLVRGVPGRRSHYGPREFIHFCLCRFSHSWAHGRSHLHIKHLHAHSSPSKPIHEPGARRALLQLAARRRA